MSLGVVVFYSLNYSGGSYLYLGRALVQCAPGALGKNDCIIIMQKYDFLSMRIYAKIDWKISSSKSSTLVRSIDWKRDSKIRREIENYVSFNEFFIFFVFFQSYPLIFFTSRLLIALGLSQLIVQLAIQARSLFSFNYMPKWLSCLEAHENCLFYTLKTTIKR